MPNVAYFPIVYYAILRLGAIVVPMNPLLKAGEIAYAWQDSGVEVAVVFPLFADEATKAVECDRHRRHRHRARRVRPAAGRSWTRRSRSPIAPLDDTAVILYTSGTTGQPKGAELTHANLGSNVRSTIETLLPMAPGDVIFGGLPLFHSFGQTVGLNSAIAGGACLTLLPKFDGEQALGSSRGTG